MGRNFHTGDYIQNYHYIFGYRYALHAIISILLWTHKINFHCNTTHLFKEKKSQKGEDINECEFNNLTLT